MTSSLSLIQVLPCMYETAEEAARFQQSVTKEWLSLKSVEDAPVPSSRETKFVCLGNRTSLFVVFSVTGSTGQRDERFFDFSDVARTPRLWELSEVVEVFIGRNARGTGIYSEFEVAPDGRWIALDVHTDSSGVRGKENIAAGFRCAVSAHPRQNLWRAAMEIPWRDLDGDPVAGPWHANFYRSIPGGDGTGLYAWSPTGSGPHCFHRPEFFGQLVVRDLPTI